MHELLPYIVDTLQKSKVKYKVDSFDSGTVWVDIWIENDFYLIQIYSDTIGLSLVTPETAWDIVPDKSFNDESAFKKAFENILR